MRRKMAFATVLTVCLALVFAPAMSASGSDRSGRGKTTPISQTAGDDGSLRATDELTRNESMGMRELPASPTAKAQTLVGIAAGQQGDAAIATLNMVLGLQLTSSPENDKLLSDVYSRLGDLYEGTASKQVHHYGVALQFTADPARRLQLESKLAAAGGDVFDVAFNGASQASRPRTIGLADSCDTAIAVGIPYDSGYTLFIDNSSFVDHDWFAFDVTGTSGAIVTIETLTDVPGDFADDTDVTLWSGCAGGFPVTQLGFNDDGGVDFMSLLVSGCLAPGTYYIEVGGWSDVGNADNFALTINQTGTCEVPQPDAYEPDDSAADASDIGLPTSIPQGANGWGRAHKEIQSHSFVGADGIDWAEFRNTRDELVRMGTAIQFPTKWNDFTQVNGGLDNDTFMFMFYGSEQWYGGLCNDGVFGTDCLSDADCGPPVIPGYPACIPWWNFGGVPSLFYTANDYGDVALAYNDDAGGTNFGSQLLLCLPPSSIVSPLLDSVSNSYFVAVEPFSLGDQFNYQLQVKNEVRCNFSDEPNSSFATATDLTLGVQWHGIHDYALFYPDFDHDLFRFDIPEPQLVRLESTGYHPNWVDTNFALYVGPDDDGLFYFTGLSNDDQSGSVWFSRLNFTAPTADDLLGNLTADANYYLDVTCLWFTPNFPYTLNSSVSALPVPEVEPNNTIATANTVGLGDNIQPAAINPACDYDVYRLPITGSQNMFVTFDILGTFDTSMELVDCATDTRIACDDDGGPGLASKIDACLAPGQDYCVKVRAYGAASTGAYGLQIGAGVAGCPNPGTGVGDGLYRCTGNQFDTCP